MTSIEPGPPRARSVQDWHTPHGSGVGPCAQFRAAGQDAGAGGLAAAAGAGEQVGVVDPVVGQRGRSGVGDVVLADDLGERLGPVAAVERKGCIHATNPNQPTPTAHQAGRSGLVARAYAPATPERTHLAAGKGPPRTRAELTDPCCLPALGELGEMPPHEGLWPV